MKKLPVWKFLRLVFKARSGNIKDIQRLIIAVLKWAVTLTSNTWDDDLVEDIEKKLNA